MKAANSMLPDLPPLKREGNIIYFPGAWQEEAPEIRRKIPNDPASLPPFEEHCEGFKGVDFGSPYADIMGALLSPCSFP
jgi:hypothetical protein